MIVKYNFIIFIVLLIKVIVETDSWLRIIFSVLGKVGVEHKVFLLELYIIEVTGFQVVDLLQLLVIFSIGILLFILPVKRAALPCQHSKLDDSSSKFDIFEIIDSWFEILIFSEKEVFMSKRKFNFKHVLIMSN